VLAKCTIAELHERLPRDVDTTIQDPAACLKDYGDRWDAVCQANGWEPRDAVSALVAWHLSDGS
jgi:hypothetical protein